MSVELEKLAEAIRGRWPQTKAAADNCDCVTIYPNLSTPIVYSPECSDIGNGAFIAFCLSKLVEAKKSFQLDNMRRDDDGRGKYRILVMNDSGDFNQFFRHGVTVAEACAQALLAALTSLPNTSLSEEENKSNG